MREGRSVVKHITYYADLPAAAHEAGIKHLNTEAVQLPNAANGETAVVKAVIETGRGNFCALGDASSRNVEPEFAPHLIRVAETRAKARALRDALNIGVVAFEEISGRIMATEKANTNDVAKAQPEPQAAKPPVPEPAPASPSRESDYWSEKQRKLIFRLLGMLRDPDSGEVLVEKPFVGVFDLRSPTGFVEFKTAKSALDENILSRHLQLSAYAYAYQLMHRKMPSIEVIQFLKLKKTPRKRRSRYPTDLARQRQHKSTCCLVYSNRLSDLCNIARLNPYYLGPLVWPNY